jgi:hypothetical protein
VFAKGVVFGPEGAWFADNHILTKLRKCHLFLPSPIHACPCHGPWATSLMAKTCRGTKWVPNTLVRAGQLRETTLTENISPPRLQGVGRRVDNPTPDKKHCHEIWGSKNWTDLQRTTLQRTKGLESWRKLPSIETNGQSFLRRPGPTKGSQANDDDILC